MILFVGDEDRGFFVKETAILRKEELRFLENNPTILGQINYILECQPTNIIFDIEQYVDAAENLAEEIKRIERAKNCDVVIYAPGYDRKSKIIQELLFRGIKYYVFSGNPGEAREELERCMSGYYIEPEIIETAEKKEEQKSGTKIGITGACNRIGTTTVSLQFVKYLQSKGYKACYIEVNATGFILKHEQTFNTVHDKYLGKVTFENVDMFYKQENLLEVLKQGYDYYVYDFGTYSDTGFNKTSFLEKDIRIFVVGSKATEMEYTMDVLRNEYYTDITYVFNFISDKEKTDLLEYMEEKAENTYFTKYTPDQFEYIHNPIFERILPLENALSGEKQKKGLFGWKKRGA